MTMTATAINAKIEANEGNKTLMSLKYPPTSSIAIPGEFNSIKKQKIKIQIKKK